MLGLCFKKDFREQLEFEKKSKKTLRFLWGRLLRGRKFHLQRI